MFYLLEGQKGTLRQGSIPTKPRFRSVPDVAVLNSQIPLLAGLFIKCRRLPRGFFWNTSLPPLIGWLFYFLKKESYHKLGNISEEIRKNNSRKRQYLYGVRVSQLSKLKGKRKEKI